MIDRIVIVASLSSLFTLYGVLLIRPYKQNVENVSTSENNSQITRSLTLPDYTKGKGKVEYSADMEETPEFSAVMYATEPIGRYYITAYNHEETGSKITASGKTCHEGTITTCAIILSFSEGDGVFFFSHNDILNVCSVPILVNYSFNLFVWES